MPKYDIERWDSVINGNNTFPMPMIYFKPDENFFDYAKKNDYQVLVEIEGTGSEYDNKKIVGVINSSANYPTYRPNFYEKTKYYVITLASGWIGYPKNNGRMIIRGLNGPDKIDIVKTEFVPPKPIPEFYTKPEKKCNNLSSTQIGWVVTAILIFFCVLLYISCVKK